MLACAVLWPPARKHRRIIISLEEEQRESSDDDVYPACLACDRGTARVSCACVACDVETRESQRLLFHSPPGPLPSDPLLSPSYICCRGRLSLSLLRAGASFFFWGGRVKERERGCRATPELGDSPHSILVHTCVTDVCVWVHVCTMGDVYTREGMHAGFAPRVNMLRCVQASNFFLGDGKFILQW